MGSLNYPAVHHRDRYRESDRQCVGAKFRLLQKGKLLKLSTIGTVTNLGQPVTWKVTKGASVCKVKTGGGYYKLKLVKAGKCTVIGSAPAVAGQWSNFSTSRKYSAK